MNANPLQLAERIVSLASSLERVTALLKQAVSEGPVPEECERAIEEAERVMRWHRMLEDPTLTNGKDPG